MKAYCFFEQSGTFKNEFKKLGIDAEDFDILNDFGETDHQIDLFNEIENCYRGGRSVFDNIGQDDLIMAFFPCIRFEVQIWLNFQGKSKQMKSWSETQKLEYCMKLHEELADFYAKVTKLTLICLKRKIPLIIENPYNTSEHYLTRYWPVIPKVIDKDRTKRGDYRKKPTQYWFFNCEPRYNFICEVQTLQKKYITHNEISNKVERSLISKEYANRFIREYIIPGEPKKDDQITMEDLWIKTNI